MPTRISRWGIFGIVYLTMVSFALVFQSVPPLLHLIIDDMAISHGQAGLLMSLFSLPGILIAIPVGIYADRYGVKRIGIYSFLLLIAGTVMVAMGPSFTVLAAGRVLGGIGGMTLAVLCPQIIAQWFAHKETGLAMGLFHSGMPVAFITAQNVLSWVGVTWDWRLGIWLTLGVAILAFAVFVLFLVQAPSAPKREQDWRGILSGLRHIGLPIWLLGLIWGLFNAAAIAMFTFAHDFMVGAGIDPITAGRNASWFMVASLFAGPVVGYMVDRLGHKLVFPLVGAICMAALFPLVPGDINQVVFLIVIIGIFSACIPSPVFSLAADVLSPRQLGVGYGILTTLLNVGAFAGPWLVGLSRDMTGTYRAGFGMMSFFTFLAAVVVVVLWVRLKGRPPRRLDG
ncbi:nitrate/nitrite transporter [Chloroflexota bacterium]